MPQESSDPIATALTATAGGDERAAEQLVQMLYQELKRLAQQRLSRLPPGQTLSATSLVHEAYARLVRHGDPGWNGRRHFFGAAANAMREILIEKARRKAAKKRPPDARRVDLEDHIALVHPPSDDVLAIHEALQVLEAEDARKGQIVNLRFFVGLTVKETAEVLDVSVGTIEREWRFIRAWLYARLSESEPPG